MDARISYFQMGWDGMGRRIINLELKICKISPLVDNHSDCAMKGNMKGSIFPFIHLFLVVTDSFREYFFPILIKFCLI